MIQQEYIMLIMNCKKYYKKAKFQKMAWLPKIPDYDVCFNFFLNKNIAVCLENGYGKLLFCK